MLFQASGDPLRLHCPSSSLTDSAVFCPSFLPSFLPPFLPSSLPPSIVHHFSSHWMGELGHKLMYKPALTEIGVIKTVQIMYFVPGNSSSAGESIGVLLCRQYIQLWEYQNNGRWARGTVTDLRYGPERTPGLDNMTDWSHASAAQRMLIDYSSILKIRFTETSINTCHTVLRPIPVDRIVRNHQYDSLRFDI